MSVIDSAIARIQDIAQACTSVTFKSAPDYPVENVEPFPCSVAYVASGEFRLSNASLLMGFPVIALELHFSRVNLKQAYQQINAIAVELPTRLAGDPTLGGSVATIVSTTDSPITYEVRPFYWTPPGVTPQVVSQMLRFAIPVKLLQNPVTA